MIYLEIKLRDPNTLRRWNFSSSEKAKEVICLIEEKYNHLRKNYECPPNKIYDVVYVSLEKKKKDAFVRGEIRSTIYFSSFDANIFEEVIQIVERYTKENK